jgi:hypothetical protein
MKLKMVSPGNRRCDPYDHDGNLAHYAYLPPSASTRFAGEFHAANQVLKRRFVLWPQSIRRRLYERGAALTTQHIVRFTSLSTKYSDIPHSLKNFYLLRNSLTGLDFWNAKVGQGIASL